MRDRPTLPAALASHLVLALVGATMLLPFLWMVATSLKSEAAVFAPGWLPRSAALGADGTQLTLRDGTPLFAAVADGAGGWRRGDALTVAGGSPRLDGAPGDRARTADGEAISDDLGQPVSIGQIAPGDGIGHGVRFRAPKLLRHAEPVLVPRGDPVNEAAARRWFARYDASWEQMVAARWDGRVPLMLTAGLRDAWTGRAGSGEDLVVAGTAIPDPDRPGRNLRFSDCSWGAPGEPVRRPRAATVVVDGRGIPVPWLPAVPSLAGEDAPLTGADGRELPVFVGEGNVPRSVRGRELALDRGIAPVWSNYETVLTDPDIRLSSYAWNSMFIAVATVALQVLTSALAAFAFSRIEWPGRDRLFFAYLATLMIPGVVTQIPNYMILQRIGWLDSFWGLIVPGAASAYGTFLLRQYMLSLPKGVEEAARIDGASLLRVWWDITLPMSRPAVITLAIFTFVGTWQSFTWPMIVAPDESVRVLPVALQSFASSRGTSYNLLMAASLVMMLPMVLLFIFGQKYFVKGINLGAVKG